MVVGTASRWLSPAHSCPPARTIEAVARYPLGTFSDEREEILRRDVGGRRPGVVLERVLQLSGASIDSTGRHPCRPSGFSRSPFIALAVSAIDGVEARRLERLDGLAAVALLNRQRLHDLHVGLASQHRGNPCVPRRAGTAKIAGYGRTELGSPRLHRGARDGDRGSAGRAPDRGRRAAGAASRRGASPAGTGVVRRTDALGPTGAGRERPRAGRSRLLARLLHARPRRRGVSQRRRRRRLLPHRHSLPSPQRLARHQQSVR